MKCQICDNPATVHLTDIVNKKKRELHLCERCARERNLIPEPPGPQIDLKALLGLLTSPFPDAGAGEALPEPVPAGCDVCGMTVAADPANYPVDHDGTTYYFCCPGCRYSFKKDPASFLSQEVSC